MSETLVVVVCCRHCTHPEGHRHREPCQTCYPEAWVRHHFQLAAGGGA